MRRFIQNCCIGLMALAAMFWAAACSAIEYEALGGRPANPVPGVENSASWFIYNLEPGEKKQDAVLVLNLFDQPMKAVIYAADSSPSSSGGFALKQLNDQQEKVGKWIRFYPDEPPEAFRPVFEQQNRDIIFLCKAREEDRRTSLGFGEATDEEWTRLGRWCEGETLIKKDMEAKEEYLLPFVFSVPENADVGEHTGGILIQKGLVEDAAEMEGSGVRLTTRVGVRVYETVPGQVIRKVQLEDFRVVKNFKEFDLKNWFAKDKKPEEYLVQSNVKNLGNASVIHQSNIILEDLFFDKRSEYVERKFQVLRDDSFIATYAWQSPRFGYFSFQTEIKYDDENGNEQSIISDIIKLWIIPWREIAVSLFAVLLVLGLVIFFRRRWNKKYSGKGWLKYVAKPGDSVGLLAQKYGTDWKTIARTNKLKKPFYLQPGQIVLLPARVEANEAAKAVNYKVSYRGLVIRLVVLALIVLVVLAIMLILKNRQDNGGIKKEINISSPRTN